MIGETIEVRVGDFDWAALARAVAAVESDLIFNKRRRLDPALVDALARLTETARSLRKLAIEVVGEGAIGEEPDVEGKPRSSTLPQLKVPKKDWVRVGGADDPDSVLAAVVEMGGVPMVALAFEVDDSREGPVCRAAGLAEILAAAKVDPDWEPVPISYRDYGVVVVPAGRRIADAEA